MRSLGEQLRGLTLLLGSVASSLNTTSDGTYLTDGPCGALPSAHFTVSVDVLDAAQKIAAQRQLKLTVTLPAHGVEANLGQIRRSAPYPVVFFFNGFLLRPAYYSAYANRLATWGYAVVQYDTGRFPILKDRQEVPFFQHLLDWLSTQPELSKTVDVSNIGVSGHSRGAKLAALHFASGHPAVKAAFLVDPVDNTRETPEGPDYPSAAKALKAAGKALGIAGASVITGCNPDGSNWQHFWPATAQGSWLMEVNGASHNTFLRANWLVERLLDLLCKRGPTSHEDTIALTMPAMTAWLDKEMRAPPTLESGPSGQSDSGRLLDQFLEWVQAQVKLNKVQFSIKD